MEGELNEKMKNVSIAGESKLDQIIKECEEHFNKKEYNQASILLKELLNMDSKDARVVELGKKLIVAEEASQSDSFPCEILDKVCNDQLNYLERLENINKLKSLTVQANSVFVSQLNDIEGVVSILDCLIKELTKKDKLIDDILKGLIEILINLTQNKVCFDSIVRKLSGLPTINIPKLEQKIVILFSELFWKICKEGTKLKASETIDQEVFKSLSKNIYPLYLNVLYSVGKGYPFSVFKEAIIPCLQLLNIPELSLMVTTHSLMDEILLDLLYNNDEESRSLALIIISKINENEDSCDRVKKKLLETFSELQMKTNQAQAFTFLKSIFQISDKIGLEVLSTDSWLLEVLDLIDFEDKDAQLGLIEVLGIACNVAEGRKLVAETSSSFLDRVIKSSKDSLDELKAQAILVKSKLSIEANSSLETCVLDGLIKPLVDIVIDKNLKIKTSSKMTAIESLTYYSLHPKVRALLGSNFLFLAAITKLGLLDEIHPAALYGISAILSNILAYRKILTKEQEQLKKLKKLSKEAEQSIDEDNDPDMKDEKVKQRNQLVIRTPNLLSLLVKLSKTKKQSIWSNLSNIYLSLATVKENHGQLFKFGTVKALLQMTTSEVPEIELISTQALCKLAIHTNPRIAFPGELKFEVIRPFLKVIQSNSSIFKIVSLLQQYEALLALTNLASESLEVRNKILHLDGLPSIELLLLSENIMVQRGATELLCNMAMTEKVFELYGKEGAKNKIHVLLALSDTDDNKTVLAASGALAILSNMPEICVNILKIEATYRILPLLIASNVGLDKQMRGIEIYKNIILAYYKAKHLFTGLSIFKLFDKTAINHLMALKSTATNDIPDIVNSVNAILSTLSKITK